MRFKSSIPDLTTWVGKMPPIVRGYGTSDEADQEEKVVYCSFCGKDTTHHPNLPIARVHSNWIKRHLAICLECLEVCQYALSHYKFHWGTPGNKAKGELAVVCSFCDEPTTHNVRVRLVYGPAVLLNICEMCVRECERLMEKFQRTKALENGEGAADVVK